MAVMAAGVHYTWILRRKGNAALFLDRQGIHVTAQGEDPAWTAKF
jgi:hypothetical protein